MITVIYVGRHEVRLAEPGLAALRFSGNLTRTQASEIAHILREHLSKRNARLLIDLAKMGSAPQDFRHELESLARDLDSGPSPTQSVAFVGAHILHKALLAPLLTRANTNGGVKLEFRFFQTQPDALDWLALKPTELFSTADSIYMTRVY